MSSDHTLVSNLYDALKNGDLLTVKFIIPSQILADVGYGLSVNFENGMTNLMIAIKYGHLEIIDYLIKNGASIENTQREIFWEKENLPFPRWSSLMLAVHYDYPKIVKYLIKQGANINHVNDENTSVLMIAVKDSHPKIVEYLIKKRANVNHVNYVNTSALMIAVQADNSRVIKLLIENKANVNFKSSKGTTALMIASKHGDLEIVRCLVEHGAGLWVQDREGRTALAFAIENEVIDIVKYLVEKDFDYHAEKIYPFFELTYENGNTLMMFIIKYKQSDFLKYLIEHIPQTMKQKYLNIENIYGDTALITAVKDGDLTMVKLLVDHEVSINHQNIFESTALIYAAIKDKKEIITYLLEKGANPAIRKNDMKTAYELSNDQTKLSFVKFYEKQINDLRIDQQTYFNIIPRDICNLISLEIIKQLCNN